MLPNAGPTPPSEIIAKIGTTMIAKNIKSPWNKSVQQTALKPPKNVYATITTKLITTAHKYGTLNT